MLWENQKAGGNMAGFLKSMAELMGIMLTKFRLIPRVWIITVMVVNLGSLYFVRAVEGRVVLGAAVLGLFIMSAIYWRLGFVRLLGLGHILWIPMVPWLWTRLDKFTFLDNELRLWILAVIVLNSLSLVLDVMDVVRYIKGERDPYYNLG
jgi:hypothetical protein